MVEKQTCPLCGQVLGPEDLKFGPSTRFDDGWDIQCRMCGESSVTLEAKCEVQGLAEGRRADLASWVCEQALHGRRPPTICSSEYQPKEQTHDYRINQILETLVPRSFSERLERILENLASLTPAPGESFGLNEYGIYACYATTVRQMHFNLNAIEEQGWLRGIADDWSAMQITASGWMKIDRLRAVGARSNQAFVAMWFADELDPVWDRGLYAGIHAAGYRPLRMKELEHNEKICDLLLTEIARSGLVVADVTGHRQSVYFEAGYAKGQGIPVIWSCREDEFEKCPFDTRQYNHIRWTTPEELAKALEKRIRESIGGPPK